MSIASPSADNVLSIALRKGNVLAHNNTQASFVTSLSSISVPKSFTEVVFHPSWGVTMEKEIFVVWSNDT